MVQNQKLQVFRDVYRESESNYAIKFDAAIVKSSSSGDKKFLSLDAFDATSKFVLLDVLFDENNRLLDGNELTFEIQVKHFLLSSIIKV